MLTSVLILWWISYSVSFRLPASFSLFFFRLSYRGASAFHLLCSKGLVDAVGDMGRIGWADTRRASGDDYGRGRLEDTETAGEPRD